MRRSGVTVAIALAILGVAAPPAAAHSTGGLDATNVDNRLTAVTPDVPGIEVEVIENGNRIEVTDTTDDDLVVLGYKGEPYLRIGADGVFENVRSPATYLNQDRRATTPVPGTADPDAEPDWRRIDDGTVARWHDHRIHWMGEGDPPAVRRDPGRRHVVVPDWVIPTDHAGTTIEARGGLLWVPGPNRWPWIGLAAAFLVAVASSLGLGVGLVVAVFMRLRSPVPAPPPPR